MMNEAYASEDGQSLAACTSPIVLDQRDMLLSLGYDVSNFLEYVLLTHTLPCTSNDPTTTITFEPEYLLSLKNSR